MAEDRTAMGTKLGFAFTAGYGWMALSSLGINKYGGSFGRRAICKEKESWDLVDFF